MLHRVNLFPWREQRRRVHQQRFFGMLVGSVVVAIVIQIALGAFLEHQKNMQHQRLGFLQAHIANLDFQLKKLKQLEVEHDSLLTRLKVVEELQAQRNKTTEFMNVMPTLIPDGVYVDKIKMGDQQVEMVGISDTTSRLATMLDLLENSPRVRDVSMHSIVHDKPRFGKKFQTFRVSFTFLIAEAGSQEVQGG
ncbi:PilN domain-containing protein [Vibrio taketomensis]|uniref:PilN domain-containing protein n=1 Tax=Vibrio taketomensis TaxID=2572923 RepID=UPI0013896A98|nr:PilN domain-containing protein [Vibrio taketomensis]